MSFWSRKNKKDAIAPTTVASSGEKATSTPSPSGIPTLSNVNGTSSASSASASNAPLAPATYNSKTSGINSPPDSPSTISPSIRSNVSSSSAGSSSSSPWSMRKFRNANPFPRFGHAANISAGKEGEIYIFGGLVKDKRKNDLFVLDSGIVSHSLPF
jgi:Galactose oxidase, central domain